MPDPSTGGPPAESIDDVLERMDEIDASLPADDGVAVFNRMYRHVTLMVKDAEVHHRFSAGDFIDRLDVHFANLFFKAHQADVAGEEIPHAWRPLFDARSHKHAAPIQFALAGMNAHISHDLPFAVVTTCQEIGVAPESHTPHHSDYTETNGVLGEASPEIKSWFFNGKVAHAPDEDHDHFEHHERKVDHGLSMLGLHTWRGAAWDASEMLWHLESHPRMHKVFRSGLAHSVHLTSKGLLI